MTTRNRHSAAELDPALDDYQLASALVREAGTAGAADAAWRACRPQQKTSVSDVVTAADHAAEAYVLEQLRRCRPEDGILGEEGASVARNQRPDLGHRPRGRHLQLPARLHLLVLGHRPEGLLRRAAGSDLPAGGGQAVARRHGPRRDAQRRSLSPSSARTGPDAQRATPLSQNSAPPPTSTPPGWRIRCAPCPGTPPPRSAAALRMFGSGSCDLGRVADGELGCWFQHSCPEWDWLPGQGDRPRRRRRHRTASASTAWNGSSREARRRCGELRAALESGSVA